MIEIAPFTIEFTREECGWIIGKAWLRQRDVMGGTKRPYTDPERRPLVDHILGLFAEVTVHAYCGREVIIKHPGSPVGADGGGGKDLLWYGNRVSIKAARWTFGELKINADPKWVEHEMRETDILTLVRPANKTNFGDGVARWVGWCMADEFLKNAEVKELKKGAPKMLVLDDKYLRDPLQFLELAEQKKSDISQVNIFA